MSLKIYHNPRCSKSRQTLKLIEDAGETVETILYLDEPLSEAEIGALLAKLGFKEARQMMRRGEAIYKELNLKDESDEKALIRAMAEHPKLIERPIVVKGNRAIMGRPPENVQIFL
nr:arsenate reductase [uncultured bacterium]